MYSYSRSSFGWDPPTKLMELFHPLSRFILVQVEGRPVAFAMFRFEYENYRNLLYWSASFRFFCGFHSNHHHSYDIQVSSDSQGAGLGTVLLRWLESIAIAWRMDKLVLTVLKGRFFYSISYPLAYIFFTDNGREREGGTVLRHVWVGPCCTVFGLSWLINIALDS